MGILIRFSSCGTLGMNREIKMCNECESEYFADTSKMIRLCPNCCHFLYGYPNCKHEFKNERWLNAIGMVKVLITLKITDE